MLRDHALISNGFGKENPCHIINLSFKVQKRFSRNLPDDPAIFFGDDLNNDLPRVLMNVEFQAPLGSF